jgi:hypothetical protein
MGRFISSATPTNGQVLVFNSVTNNWTPTTLSSGSSQWKTTGTTSIYSHKRVGINTSTPGNTLQLKDTILGTANANYASAEFNVRGSNGAQSSSYALWVSTTGNNGYKNVGIRGWAGGTANTTYTNGGSIGGEFYAYGTGGQNNYGSRSHADDGVTVRSYGVYAVSRGDAQFNIGIIATSDKSHNSTSKTNYGVYAVGDSARTDYAGYFSGNVTYTGTLASASDSRLKQNVKPLNGALLKLQDVKVATYEYKKTGVASKMNLPEGEQIGFIAQDLEKNFPELVKEQVHAIGVEDGAEETQSFEYKAVNYIGMVPVLTKAIQEQQEYIKKLEERIKALESQKQ